VWAIDNWDWHSLLLSRACNKRFVVLKSRDYTGVEFTQ